MKVPALIDFNNTLQEWDGFGVNYVEVAQTRDYKTFPQEYGGFSTLSEGQRQEILEYVFGEDGLKPSLVKLFLDCHHQEEPDSIDERIESAELNMEMRGNIYSAKVNGIIPWACIQLVGGWVGGDPNPGCAFAVDGQGHYTVRPGYYYYKQVSRAGQGGMAVAQANSADTEVAIIAFASNGTKHPDAFVLINIAEEDKEIELHCFGIETQSFQAFRTSPQENYVSLGKCHLSESSMCYTAPAGSVTTFFGEM